MPWSSTDFMVKICRKMRIYHTRKNNLIFWKEEEEGGFGDVGRIMQVFRIARIMRIFKLARRSVGLQSIAHTVRTSWKDLGLLFMLVGMGMLVFGSLEYYIENAEPNTGFTSIPQVSFSFHVLTVAYLPKVQMKPKLPLREETTKNRYATVYLCLF